MDLALGYIKRHGITTWANYPYQGVTGKCNANKESQAVATITGAANVPRSGKHAFMAAVAQQPVAFEVESLPDFSTLYFQVFSTDLVGLASIMPVLLLVMDKTS